jgi:hypothetical protein
MGPSDVTARRIVTAFITITGRGGRAGGARPATDTGSVETVPVVSRSAATIAHGWRNQKYPDDCG